MDQGTQQRQAGFPAFAALASRGAVGGVEAGEVSGLVEVPLNGFLQAHQNPRVGGMVVRWGEEAGGRGHMTATVAQDRAHGPVVGRGVRR